MSYPKMYTDFNMNNRSSMKIKLVFVRKLQVMEWVR